MKYILLLLFPFLAYAGEQDKALETSLRAAYEYPEVKSSVKTVTNYAFKIVPLEREFATTLVVTAIVLMHNKVSTEKVKNISFKINDGVLRPDFIYNTKDYNAVMLISYKVSFP